MCSSLALGAPKETQGRGAWLLKGMPYENYLGFSAGKMSQLSSSLHT